MPCAGGDTALRAAMATASCAQGDGTTALCMSEFLSVQVSQTVTVEGGLLRQPFPLPVLQLRDQLYAPVEMSDWMCKVPHWRGVYCAILCVLRCLGAAAALCCHCVVCWCVCNASLWF